MKITKNHLLLLAVVMIWAAIGYQLFEFIGHQDGDDSMNSFKARSTKDTTSARSYTLLANYRDPFIQKKNKLTYRSGTPARIPSSTVQSQPARMATIQWPDMKYSGMIENNKLKTRIALLKKDNVNLMLRETEKVGDFTIDRIWKDSVRIKYDKAFFVYKKTR
jgi:hypothetical protein